MGSWGYGILQNDTAQDGMCDVAHRIETEIAGMAGLGSEENAAKIGAATGLLLLFSRYSFNTDNSFYKVLIDALTANREYFVRLPGDAANILNSIIDGRGSELADRPGEVDPEIDKALHSDENNEFIMQKAFSHCEHDLFRHPVAAEFIQEIIDQIVEEVDEGFDDEELVSDLSREAEFMGPFALLLILPAGRVDPDKFRNWRTRFHEVWRDVQSSIDEDESEKEFADKYNGYLEVAFQCGITNYSKQ